MSLGKEWTGTSWNSAGLCVNTAGHILLSAQGSTAEDTTMSLLAEGSSGQFLMQSLNRNAYVYSEDHSIASAKGSMLVAGGKGVKIICGHGRDYEAAFGISPLTDNTLSKVAYGGNGSGIEAYMDRMDEVSSAWTATLASCAAAQLITEGVRLIVGCRGVGKGAGAAMAFTAATNAVTATAGAVQLASTGTDDVPGLHIHSLSGMDFVTPLFASFYSGAAIQASSMLCSFIGWSEAAVIGGASASLKASKSATVQGKNLHMTAGRDQTIGSLHFDAKLYGKDIEIGAPIPSWPTQLPSLTATVASLGKVDGYVNAGRFELKSAGTIEVDGMTIRFESSKCVIEGLTYSVSIGSKVELSVLGQSGLEVEANTGVVAECGPVKLEVTDCVKISAGAQNSLSLDGSGGVVKISGGTHTML